jgi:hypothetical protein
VSLHDHLFFDGAPGFHLLRRFCPMLFLPYLEMVRVSGSDIE